MYWLIVAVVVVGGGVVLYLRWPSTTNQGATPLEPPQAPPGKAKATFAGGCFWCTEAVFEQLKGVESAVSGYCGGSVKGPSYERVCTGWTGHAEAVQVTYDPKVISYEELLDVFWHTHDPTTRDQQGNDHGTQYRSVIFYHTDEQKKLAERSKQALDASGELPRPVVTEIVPFVEFYRAEAYHQDFFERNPTSRYCQAVIRPKVAKMQQKFQTKLKPGP
jgi:peptide-methionine (S)-S-oxide reductase